MAQNNNSNEIKIIRSYDASVKTVWEAWADTKRTALWWGPRGFTLTTHSKDLRTGGNWTYTMHGPDGTNYQNKTPYLKVEEFKSLIYDHGGNDDRPPLFRVHVDFTETHGKTQIEMKMVLPTPEAANETRKFIKKAGGEATWDRLAEYLAKESSQKEIFVINRSFDAPIKLIYEMWTDPKQFSQWLAPTGFTMKFFRSDIQPGGSAFYVMTDGKQIKMYGRVHYLKFDPPHQLLYTQQFCDENEKISRHPMAPTWPETMLTQVVLTEESPDRTRVTVTWEPYGKPTREEMDTFIQSRAGMTQGWTGSFDKLDDKLENYLLEKNS